MLSSSISVIPKKDKTAVMIGKGLFSKLIDYILVKLFKYITFNSMWNIMVFYSWCNFVNNVVGYF